MKSGSHVNITGPSGNRNARTLIAEPRFQPNLNSIDAKVNDYFSYVGGNVDNTADAS